MLAASNVLLDLAGSTLKKSNADRHPNYRVDNIDDERILIDPSDSSFKTVDFGGILNFIICALTGHSIDCQILLQLIDRRSESTSISSDGDISDSIWSLGSFGRKYAEVLSNSKADSAISSECAKSDIPQKVLESLFNFPKSTEHNTDTMNWRNVVKKIQSLGPGFNVSPHVAESQQRTYAKGDEYHVFREDSKQQWNAVKSYYTKAATAYTKGNGAYAAYLSDQTLRVITGCGSHGFGKSKLKQSVIDLLEREAIEWREENRGTVLIKLNQRTEYSFLDSNSDSDSND
ncbi:unnamed protein product [Sphenostylis stenocarpa]|uniref:Smr domain-containing protein n=1 Tax=Sphenostylis stenocarpa TaxID=92480 RepID=A0AA86SV10_9FABA|nr:unnamed protein product [Sphenostylis stenocarpa]